MPKFYEAQAMQELVKLIKQNVDWRDSRDVQKHLAYGPVIGRKSDDETARVWRWIPQQVAYEAGLPVYIN